MPSAQFVGTNNIQSVRPATMSAGNWQRTLFGNNGFGCFVPGYSSHGACVIAGTGGHLAPSHNGAALFDFADNTWKYQGCTNASFTELDNTGASVDYATAATSGSPYFEVTGPTGVPAPPHAYASSVGIPVGTKGSYLYVTRAAVCNESNLCAAVNAMNIDTGAWSRFTNDLCPILSFDCTSIFDEAGNRVFFFTNQFDSFQTLHYLNLSSGLFATLGSYSFPSSMTNGTFSHDIARGFIICHTEAGALRAIDLANPNNGWINVTVSGTLPAAEQTHWCYFPPDGKFYRVLNAGGNTIGRLVMNSIASATYDTITLGGDTVPPYGDGAAPVATSPYRALMYVPALGKMAWVSGNSTAITNNQQVTLLDISGGAGGGGGAILMGQISL